MTQYYNLLSDKEAVIWLMEYAKKSKSEALQIVNGFRKSHHGIGVADRMKIHAEVLPGCILKQDISRLNESWESLPYPKTWEFADLPTEHCLVSWLPRPLINSANKDKDEQKVEIAKFKAESGFPDWYEVSFGSINHVAGMAVAHFNATKINPFNGVLVRTDTFTTNGLCLELGWNNSGVYPRRFDHGQIPMPGLEVFGVGVVKALPIVNLIPDGYEIMKDVEPSKFEMKDLEYVSFLDPGKDSLSGKHIRQRAVELSANLGFADAKYIMVRSEQIPHEFRNKHFLFPSTILFSSGGSLSMPYIYRKDDGSWCLGYLRVDSAFYNQDYFVRCKQQSEITEKG